MNLTDYPALALRTNSDVVGTHGRASIDRAHAALGLCDEAEELRQALEAEVFDRVNLVEECGDLLWFVVLYGVSLDDDPINGMLDLPIEGYLPAHLHVEQIGRLAMRLSGLAKKPFAYGADAPEQARPILRQVVQHVAGILLLFGHRLEDAAEANIRKLQARFPGAFDAGRAIRRDTAAEALAVDLPPGAVLCATPEAADAVISNMNAAGQAPQRRYDSTLRQWVVWPSHTDTAEGGKE